MNKMGIALVAMVGLLGGCEGTPGATTNQDTERTEKITCIRYTEALIRRAIQCNDEGFAINSNWYATGGDGPVQLQACMRTNYPWKRSGYKTAKCTDVVSTANCARFNDAPWLDGPPCVN